MVDWDRIRKDFPITKKSAYFQSAAMSPIPTPVYKAIISEYKKLHLQGDITWMKDRARFKILCADLAKLLNTESDNVTFVQNTSTAMSLLALSFKNQAKKPFNIVSMKDEFPASTIGFEYQKIKMRYVEPVNARFPIPAILEKTDKQTLAVVTSQVQYATGFRQDIRSLGKALHRRGILLVVNSTQAFPFFPVDVRAAHVDVLTASLHKWGLTGHIGTMFFTTPEFRKKYPSPWAGWLSVDTQDRGFIHTEKNVPFRLLKSAHRYEFGTTNLQPLVCYQVTLDYIRKIGIPNIQARIFELADYLIGGLKELGVKIISPVRKKSERSAIVSFTLGEKNRACIKKCAEKKIYITLRDGNIRVSVNIFNNFADIDRLFEVIKTV